MRLDRRFRGCEAQLLSRVAGAHDPAEAMSLLVEQLLEDAEQETPPINLDLVASFQGVTSVERVVMKEAGIIASGAQGLRILVNTKDPEGRQNFSICHEICHTLFPHFLKHPAAIDQETGLFSIKKEVEWLCDFGASRLLLPPTVLRNTAASYGPSLDAILGIAEEFRASIEATAYAWTALDLWPCAVVVFEDGFKPSQRATQFQMALPTMEEMRVEPELRVRAAFVAPSMQLFVPRYKSVPRDSAIYHSFSAQTTSCGRETLTFSRKSLLLDTESVFAPYRRGQEKQGRVITILKLASG